MPALRVVIVLTHASHTHTLPTLCPALQGLNERCARELAVISEQYPFEPLKFLPKSLRLTFAEGIEMLQAAGYDVSLDLCPACLAPS
jgi:hypothetical protein